MSEYKLFVRNLSYGVTDQILHDTFAEHGEVAFARLCTDRETNKSRGFGFVSYTTKEAADAAMEKLNGIELEGRQIEVKEAESKPERSGGGDRGGRGGDRRGGGDRGDRGGDRGDRSSGECFAFKKGNCKYGDSCKFSHENGGGSRPRSNDDEDAPRKQYKGGDDDDEPRRDRKKRSDKN